MSRNFELLQQLELARDLFAPSVRPAVRIKREKARDWESLVRDQEIRLIQRVFPSPGARRVIMFCGVEHGDGSSGTLARTARALAAQNAGTVCAVDTDLRFPSLHDHFGMENINGLAEAISHYDAVRNYVHQLAIPNLWLMPCGPNSGEIHTLLASDRFRARLKELRAEFDHILISAPPVGLYADAITLGRLADGAVLVVGANSTRREAARKAKECLQQASVNLVGAVLNNRTFPIPEALYRRI